MSKEDLIRDRLNDPDIEIVKVDEDGKGAFAVIVVKGATAKLRRLVSEHFDIEGKPMNSNEGVHARVRPKW